MLQTNLVNWASSSHVALHRQMQFGSLGTRSLDAIAGEIIGARLMRKLGIGCPEPSKIRVASADEAQSASREWWVVKGLLGINGRLKFGGIGTLNVLIPRIRGAISLVSLREIYGVEGITPVWKLSEQPIHLPWHISDRVRPKAASDVVVDNAVVLENMREFLHTGRLSVLNPSAFFSDFVAPKDWSAIRAAIAWNSDQMLAIHAARLFLGCTTAHTGNILVDHTGQLYSVDHECCLRLDGSELRILRNNIKPSGKVWDSLSRIAELKPIELARLFDGLPEDVHWPLGSKQKTVGYFLERLSHWTACFGSPEPTIWHYTTTSGVEAIIRKGRLHSPDFYAPGSAAYEELINIPLQPSDKVAYVRSALHATWFTDAQEWEPHARFGSSVIDADGKVRLSGQMKRDLENGTETPCRIGVLRNAVEWDWVSTPDNKGVRHYVTRQPVSQDKWLTVEQQLSGVWVPL